MATTRMKTSTARPPQPVVVGHALGDLGLEAARARPSHTSRRPMVDTRGLGRPPVLRPDGKDWQTFEFKVGNYLEASRSGAREALQWAADQDGPITDEERDVGVGHFVDSVADLEEEVYVSLSAILEGEALDILLGTTRGRGLEAWRRLNQRFNGAGPARIHSSLQSILNSDSLTLKTMSAGIIQWEERVRLHERRTRESLGDRAKGSILMTMDAGHGPLTWT